MQYETNINEVDISDLSPIQFSIRVVVNDRFERQTTAVAIEVQGKKIDKNYALFNVDRNKFYSDPLSCCIAGIKSIIQEDQEWYCWICATLEERNSKGIPNEQYSPNIKRNLYGMYTYYMIDPSFGKRVDYHIKNYIRIGGMHGFLVECTLKITKSNGETYYKQVDTLLAIEEFSNGKFRWAYEWMCPGESIATIMGEAILERTEDKSYREEIPDRHHRIPIYGLYKSETEEYPLTILFRGGVPQQQNEYRLLELNTMELVELQKSIDKISSYDDYLLSIERKKLEGLLDKESLGAFDRCQERVFNMNHSLSLYPSSTDIAYIIDGKDILFSFYYDKHIGGINSMCLMFRNTGDYIKQINYRYNTYIIQFFQDERVWASLSEKITTILNQ